MNEWKWSNGSGYYKSARQYPKQKQQEEQDEHEEHLEKVDDSAINQSLNGFEDFAFESTFSRNSNSSGNRREDLDNKISGRDPLFQRGTNPFLQDTDYVNDVSTRDMFLKPVNTTFDKIEHKE